jgi:hypothetical protein
MPAKRREVPGLSIGEPVRRPDGLWSQTVTDPVTEDSVTKVFATRNQAAEWVANTMLGVSTTHEPLDLRPPGVRRQPQETACTEAATSGVQSDHRSLLGRNGSGAKAGKFNLRKVAEVLESYELDPIAHLAQILTVGTPLVDPKTGDAQLDAQGQPVYVSTISPTDRAKLFMELAQFVHPKLKAVEMKVEDKRSLTEAQLTERLARVMGSLSADPLASSELRDALGTLGVPGASRNDGKRVPSGAAPAEPDPPHTPNSSAAEDGGYQ